MINLNDISYEIPPNPFGWPKNSWLWRENWEWWFYDVYISNLRKNLRNI